jgi:stringent starvation protein B
MSQNRLPPKKDVALALLESSTVFLHLDPRVEEVKVPPWFKRQPQLVLQIGLNMPVPIHDLNLDDAGVSCTLSFNRMPHFCHVPWKAIYALVAEDGRGMLWPEDIPPEVSAQAQVRAQTQETRSRLHAVPAVAAKRPAPSRFARARATISALTRHSPRRSARGASPVARRRLQPAGPAEIGGRLSRPSNRRSPRGRQRRRQAARPATKHREKSASFLRICGS